MINPAKLFQMKSAWDTFSNNHPKFSKFLKAAGNSGIDVDTVIEINITKANGENLCSNLRVTESDMQLFENLKQYK